MTDVLAGVNVVEVSMWAFVPSAGAVLAEWGADVVKIEPPTGDPMRGLISAGVGPMEGIVFPWELWNRGKRTMALDLSSEQAQEIVLSLCEDADVFLTSYLPPVRRKLGIDEDAGRARNPGIVYACGSGQGYTGPEADKGGYDSISFWSRGAVAAAATPPGAARPVNMPSGAFGDSLSGATLAGGIAAALLKRERTGEGTLVDVSLLGTAAWSMQMSAVGAAVFAAMMGDQALAGDDAAAEDDAPAELPPIGEVMNPLVHTYKTRDGRWVALCMLQFDRYWEGLARAIGREDLLTDERFADPAQRAAQTVPLAEELQRTFITRPLAEWREVLAAQPGQWDVLQLPGELRADPQLQVNGHVQQVDYGEGRALPLFSSPVHFGRQAPTLTPAPAFGQDTDDVLREMGWDDERILQAKIDGGVV
jgi:crotonobetainyl-CoA:carnitine CoA-transferase CaiB-like acyl-CoA transferase